MDDNTDNSNETYKKVTKMNRTKNKKIIKIIFLLAIVLLFIRTYYVIKHPERDDILLNLVAIVFGFLAGIFSLLQSSVNKDEEELSQIILERKELNEKIEHKNEPDIFDTIKLSLNQLNEYYAINKTQAKSSFRFSLLAIVLGLATIIIGIWLFYYGENPSINTTVLTSISGTLLEFIGGAYFFMYKKSLEQVNFFFGQLIKVQDTMLAINLSKGMDDKPKAGEMTEKIITSLLERSLK